MKDSDRNRYNDLPKLWEVPPSYRMTGDELANIRDALRQWAGFSVLYRSQLAKLLAEIERSWEENAELRDQLAAQMAKLEVASPLNAKKPASP